MPDRPVPGPNDDPLESGRNQPDPLLRRRLGSVGIVVVAIIIIIVVGMVAYGWGR